MGQQTFCEAELTLLLLFWKRRIPLNAEFCWGLAPRPPGSASQRLESTIAYHKAEQTFYVSKKRSLSRDVLLTSAFIQRPFFGFFTFMLTVLKADNTAD
jgi:hypothetical protein